MNHLQRAALALILFSGGAMAQGLEDFIYTAPLKLNTQGALYEATLTPATYAAIERRDLGDLRVFNKAGELVPYALVRPTSPEREAKAPVSLPYFPLYGDQGGSAADLVVRVDKSTDGRVTTVVSSGAREKSGAAVLGYLIDAHDLKENIGELRLRWAAGPEGTNTRVNLAVSDDLAAWRTVASGVPLLSLRQGDAVLERNNVELEPRRAKYWRLSWEGNAQAIALQAVEAVPAETLKEKTRSWSAFSGKASAKAGEYVFELNSALPVDRVRVEVPQANSIVPVSLLVRDNEGEDWRPVKSFVAYRLGSAPNEVNNPALELNAAARYWLVKVDPRNGGLGSGMPTLHAGWIPHRLIFNARGEAPFTLALGNPLLTSAALSAEGLVPGYGSKNAYALASAEVQQVEPNARSTVERKIGQRFGLDRSVDLKRAALWAALIAAVLVIGFMAWRLLRQMPKDSGPN